MSAASALQALWRGFTAMPEVLRRDEGLAARLRARQVAAVLQVSPVAAMANAANAVLLCAVFWRSSQRAQVLLWSVLVLALAARIFWVWRGQRTQTREKASPRAISRATAQAGLLGLIWGALPVMALPEAGPGQQLLLSVVITGMICAGAFALAAVPFAGTAYVATLSGGSVVALLLAPLDVAPFVMALLALYSLIVTAAVWSTARLFAERFVAEEAAKRQQELIGVLLQDFEADASDLLLETDARGCLVHITQRHETVLAQSAPVLARSPVADAVRRLLPGDEESKACLAALWRSVQRGEAFRDQPLPLLRGSETRWWSVSGKPLREADGTVRGWRGVAKEITEQRRSSERLNWLANHDTLTGLSNRHAFSQRVEQLMAQSGDTQAEFAVMSLDLDHFKGVNDTLGHVAGDGLLRALAGRLRENTRATDTVARLGGDEFAVLMHPVRSDDEALALTQRLREGLAKPFEVRGTLISVHTSFGVAIAPRDGQSTDELLASAEMALFDAKQAGRGEIRVYVPRMAERMRRRNVLEQALRQATARGQMRLVFQPQVSLETWAITGFEALLRWRHPQLGDVLPDEFVGVAEDAGLMPALGVWALAEACRIAQDWPAHLTVAVNVSPLQAMSRDFSATALAIAAAQAFPCARLELEITESSFMNDAPTTLANLKDLHTAGVRITLDDFGTGFSSLAYLRRFRFDKIKIDRAFVREVLTHRDARAIVQTVITLARKLDMQCLAEGVQDAAQAELFRRYGCHGMQGALVAGPLEADALPAFMADWRASPPSTPAGELPETDAMPLP